MSQPEAATRDRILDAATSAFAAEGLAGARVEAIAKEAGCNKQLIYHYFGSKAGLYEAVVLRVLSEKPPPVWGNREELEAHLATAVRDIPKHAQWLRMLMWEALADEGEPLVAEASRRESLAATMADAQRAQRAGLLAPEVPSQCLLLAVMGMTMVPWLLPQLTRLVCGKGNMDPAFQQEYATALGKLFRRLGPDVSFPPDVSAPPEPTRS